MPLAPASCTHFGVAYRHQLSQQLTRMAIFLPLATQRCVGVSNNDQLNCPSCGSRNDHMMDWFKMEFAFAAADATPLHMSSRRMIM